MNAFEWSLIRSREVSANTLTGYESCLNQKSKRDNLHGHSAIKTLVATDQHAAMSLIQTVHLMFYY